MCETEYAEMQNTERHVVFDENFFILDISWCLCMFIKEPRFRHLKQKFGSIWTHSTRLTILINYFCKIDMIYFYTILKVHIKIVLYGTHAYDGCVSILLLLQALLFLIIFDIRLFLILLACFRLVLITAITCNVTMFQLLVVFLLCFNWWLNGSVIIIRVFRRFV